MERMTPEIDEVIVSGDPLEGLAWPTVDPDLAVSLMLQEIQLLMLNGQALPDDPSIRDLSPLGR
jgi:hypothetical protein